MDLRSRNTKPSEAVVLMVLVTVAMAVVALAAAPVRPADGDGAPYVRRRADAGPCNGDGEVLAANYPTNNTDYLFYSSLAQRIRVLKACRITSLTTSFFTFLNTTNLENLELWTDTTLSGGTSVPGALISASSIFNASPIKISKGDQGKKLNVSTIDPSGIQLAPGYYWITVWEGGERFGWVANLPTLQDPSLPIVIEPYMAQGGRDGRWTLAPHKLSVVLGFHGCIEHPNQGDNNDDDDVGTIVGTVLGVIFGVCLLAAGFAALLGWLRKQKRASTYQHIELANSNEPHYGL